MNTRFLFFGAGDGESCFSSVWRRFNDTACSVWWCCGQGLDAKYFLAAGLGHSLWLYGIVVRALDWRSEGPGFGSPHCAVECGLDQAAYALAFVNKQHNLVLMERRDFREQWENNRSAVVASYWPLDDSVSECTLYCLLHGLHDYIHLYSPERAA